MAAAIWASRSRKARWSRPARAWPSARTDARGEVLVAGLANYVPVTVGIDTSSLADPMLAPKQALQVVTPRPGIAADVEIALVGAGDIEGAVVKDGGDGFEGLELELVDASGKVVATTRSDLTASSCSSGSPTAATPSASAAESGAHRQGRDRRSALTREVSGDAPVARLGAIAGRHSPEIAGIIGQQSRLARLCAELRHRWRYCEHIIGSAAARDHDGAVEKTRTSTAFRPQRPQRCASTSSATTAFVK